MSIFVDVEDLIRTRRIEECRVVLYPKWEPAKVMHDICAFANDIEGYGCGYIVIGATGHGYETEIPGIPDRELDEIEKELPHLCGLITPRCIPRSSRETCAGKNLFIIVTEKGRSGPFVCPGPLDGTRGFCYVRRDGKTVRMKKTDSDLLYTSHQYPFDMRPCLEASPSDIWPVMMYDYLSRLKSDILDSRLLPADVDSAMGSMRLIYEALEGPKPRYAALLMFAEDPERFVPYARIDIVNKPDPTGEGMEERSFRGPVYVQAIQALMYLRNAIVAERTYKHSDRPESTRVSNFPYDAVKEALINAICHRDYQTSGEIVVTITPDSMTIRNNAWCPQRSCEDVRNGDIDPMPCINPMLRDFFQNLGLAGGRCSGISWMRKVMEYNESEPPEFRLYDGPVRIWETVLKINPRFKEVLFDWQRQD